jgi:hypothetical protein
MLHKHYDHKLLVAKNISGREPQGAWHEDKLIAGKPPVVKQLTHSLQMVNR